MFVPKGLFMQRNVSPSVVSYWLFAAALVRIGLDCVRHKVDAWPNVWQHEIMFYVGVVFVLLALLARWKPLGAAISSLVCYAFVFTYFFATVGQYAGIWIWFEFADLAPLCGALGFALGMGSALRVHAVTAKAKWLQAGVWCFFAIALLPTGIAVLAFAGQHVPGGLMQKLPEQALFVIGVVTCTMPLLTITEYRKLPLASLGCVLAACTLIGVMLLVA